MAEDTDDAARSDDRPPATRGDPAPGSDESADDDGWTTPARVLAAVAIALCLASLAFPFYALDAYGVDARPVPDDFQPDDPEEDGAVVVDFEELSEREQAIAEAAIRGDDVTMYAPFYDHQKADGALPPLFSDNWIGDYEVGAYVQYEGSYYEVHTRGGVPFHYAVVIPAGLLVGLTLLGGAWLSNRQHWRVPPYVAAVLGCLALVLLLWIGNVDGYVWPVQY